ncbi:14 kDa phosphohistidine phosphatase-like isoform X1 [Zootermopsis nevadensis]|uniref:14 kDa phosphohistidine phosphatase-like isoform X1 n=1 Tax=Zootermopsis nevadensis TaxID=136037 RepID=UPI000B8E4B43|nr:14 kDa phosphohistidine phosphatase-like isoform X1 [Zootermopsis nevadensis]
MTSEKLESIPDVEIDPDGTFKYVLIKVYGGKKADSSEEVKTVVRGFKWGEYHGNIYDKTSEAVQALGLDSECIGGGRIKHDAAAKKILVYGYSQGFGKADHEVTVSLLKKKYTDYNISWSDAGY